MKVKNTTPQTAVKNRPSSSPTTHGELNSLKEKITDLISDDPQKAAIILTEWLKQADRATQKKKAG